MKDKLDKWDDLGRSHDDGYRQYLNREIMSNPYKDRKPIDVNEILANLPGMNELKENEIMSEPKEEKTCLKTLAIVLEMMQESWPANVESEYMYGMTQGYSSITMLIQSKALVEMDKLAKESESD